MCAPLTTWIYPVKKDFNWMTALAFRQNCCWNVFQRLRDGISNSHNWIKYKCVIFLGKFQDFLILRNYTQSWIESRQRERERDEIFVKINIRKAENGIENFFCLGNEAEKQWKSWELCQLHKTFDIIWISHFLNQQASMKKQVSWSLKNEKDGGLWQISENERVCGLRSQLVHAVFIIFDHRTLLRRLNLVISIMLKVKVQLIVQARHLTGATLESVVKSTWFKS